jgi:hypothetical protein
MPQRIGIAVGRTSIQGRPFRWKPHGGNLREAYSERMHPRLFEPFRQMLQQLPAGAILKAAEAERVMIQEDIIHQRIAPDDEALSVFEFCRFLEAATKGVEFSIPAWPIEHWAFYRSIVHRLIEFGELPPRMQEAFDRALLEKVPIAARLAA